MSVEDSNAPSATYTKPVLKRLDSVANMTRQSFNTNLMLDVSLDAKQGSMAGPGG